MSDKFAGGIKCGSTDVTIPIILRSTTDNTEVTGKIYSDVTASYQRQGEARVSIATTSQTVTGAHTDGGFVEIDATNMPGNYRFDIPDAAFADGADWVVISVKVAGCYIFYERYNLESAGASDVYDRIGPPAGANIAADLATIDDYVDELESRLTATRAGYLDNLSGGAVALASVCTETRLAELDSANIPSDIDAILVDTDELQSNQNNWLTATGFSTHSAADVWAVSTRVLTANTNLNDIDASTVKTQVDNALADIKLDHLISSAVDTDWETTVNLDSVIGHMADNGSSATFNRATDSLEAIRDRGDSAWSAGVANPNMLLSAEIDTVNDQTHFTLVTGSNEDDAYNDQTIVLYDDSNYDYPCVRKITDYDGSTKTVTIDSAPIFTLGADDSVKIFATAPGTTAPTASEIREEIDNNSTKLASIRSIASFIRAKLL